MSWLPVLTEFWRSASLSLNPCLPRFRDAFFKAHEEALVLIGQTLHAASGVNFQDLPAPPPLSVVARAYFIVMREHFQETVQKRGAVFAEQAARETGGHAAEILSPTDKCLGYTFYHVENPDHSLS